MTDFDFSRFIHSPCDFIQDRIQTRVDPPDFGITEDLNKIFAENPKLINQIPLVTKLSEVQACLPESLVRIRAVMRSFNESIVVPLAIETENGNYSFLARSKIPEDIIVSEDVIFNPTPGINFHLATGNQIIVELVDDYTQWTSEYLQTQKMQISKKSHDCHCNPTLILVRDLKNDNNLSKCYKVVDIIGYFEESQFDSGNSPFDSFTAFIPTFVSLYSKPVDYFFDIDRLPEDQFENARQITLKLLSTVFDEKTAEIVLLWLLSRVRSRVGAQLVGIFSLNLFEISPEQPQIIINFLNNLCTSLTAYSCSIDNLNQKNLKPTIFMEGYQKSPIFSFENNRIIFDETQLSEGTLNETGTQNLRMINELVNFQSIVIQNLVSEPGTSDNFQFDMKIDISNPSLVLSTTRSLIDCDIHIPCSIVGIGEINVSEEELSIARAFIDQARFSEINLEKISKENSEAVIAKILAVKKSNDKYTQADLNLFVEIATCIMISHGTTEMTNDILTVAEEILQYMLPHRK